MKSYGVNVVGSFSVDRLPSLYTTLMRWLGLRGGIYTLTQLYDPHFSHKDMCQGNAYGGLVVNILHFHFVDLSKNPSYDESFYC